MKMICVYWGAAAALDLIECDLSGNPEKMKKNKQNKQKKTHTHKQTRAHEIPEV